MTVYNVPGPSRKYNLDDNNLVDQHTLDASTFALADDGGSMSHCRSEGVTAETGALATERRACGRRGG